jgi:hypothetical protein
MGLSGQHHAPAALYPRKRIPVTHWIGGWVCFRAGLDTEARGKLFCLSWLVVSLFYDAFSVTRLYSVGDRMTCEWRWIGKDLVGSGHDLILRYYPGIRLEGLKKTTKNLNQDSRWPESRFEPGTYGIRSSSVNYATTTFSASAGNRNPVHPVVRHSTVWIIPDIFRNTCMYESVIMPFVFNRVIPDLSLWYTYGIEGTQERSAHVCK